MATETTDYDEFYRGDEREYKLKVLRQDTTGAFIEAEQSIYSSYDGHGKMKRSELFPTNLGRVFGD